MISIVLGLLYIGLLVLPHGAWAGEKLAYAIVYKGSDYTGVKTDILSIDPETDEKRLVFSDEKTSIVLLQHLYVFHFPVVAGCKLFAHAADRGKSVPFPGNGSLCELSADGSNLYRKITHVLGAQSPGDIFVNSGGTRIGYINRMNRRQYVFIHDVLTGKVLHQIDVTEKFLDCFASSIGWLPRRETLFFSLESGDTHVTSEASYARVGTYFMDEPGEQLTKLQGIPAHEGFFPPETVRMIGVLPTGEYIFEAMQQKKRPLQEQNQCLFSILKVRDDFLNVEDMSFSPLTKLYSGLQVNYRLSPSGKYLAAAKLPISSSALSCDIWVKNLHSGKENKILSLPTKGLQGPFLGLVGWLD